MAKTLIIIAGPNGSGKTTFAEIALIKRKDSLYVNSDSIARGLTLNGNEYAQFEAGRIMLKYINKFLMDGRSFAFETTFSGKIWTSYIQKAKKMDYKIIMYFVFVKNISLSLERINNRVKNGGHGIPEVIVQRRFAKTFTNFLKIYSSFADEWYVIDNSIESTLIAMKIGRTLKISNPKIFNKYFK